MSLVFLQRLSPYSYRDKGLRFKDCENPRKIDNLFFLDFHLTTEYVLFAREYLINYIRIS